MNFDRLAMLLHLKEQLVKHPNLTPILAHVDAELAHAANAAAEEKVERPPTAQEVAEAERAELALKNEEERRQQEETDKRTELDNEAERQRAEQEQRRGLNADDDLKRVGQPRVPEPNPQQDLSRMNNPAENRVEARLSPKASEPVPPVEPVPRRI